MIGADGRRRRGGSTSSTSTAVSGPGSPPTTGTDVAGHFVADAQALDSHRLLVIERDGGRG